MHHDIEAIQEKIHNESAFVERLLGEVGRVIVGQRAMVERLVIGLLADGHVLLEGVPGLAKTLTVRTLARAIDTAFQRIQFTPDLLPADLIGTLVYDPQHSEFRTKKGPIFSNLILADEINRSPAKVQSALLEAMAERTVTIGDTTYRLDQPFLVLATQNPIEQEGTYPLPEAQVDRFMFKVVVGYPGKDEEIEVMRRMATGAESTIEPVVHPDDIRRARAAVEMIYMDPQVERYIVDLVFATRDPASCGLKGPEPAHRVRRLAARDDQPRPGGAGARVPPPARLRDAGGRPFHRSRRAPPPRAPHLRGGSRGGVVGRGRQPRARARRSAVDGP